jgi:cell division protein FtsQ
MARTASPPATLPVDVRLLQLSGNVVGALALVTLAALAFQALGRMPLFALQAIQVEGEVDRNSANTIRANAAPKLVGNFFSIDLGKARAAFESVPWVRRAVVRRVWPNRLVVRLEEEDPQALWASPDGNDRLVNRFGELFEANLGDVEDETLPRLAGPEGSAPQMLAMLRRLEPVLSRLDAGDVESLALSGRGSWRVGLEGGAEIELGRGSDDDVIARTERFVRTVAQVTGRFQRPLESADLRHPDGYAVRLRGVTTEPQPAPAKRGGPPPARPTH